jgi:methionyl-tRNA formyltransferase
MRIVLIGSVIFSAHALRELIAMGADVVGVCTLSTCSFNADHEDLRPIAMQARIPVNSAADIHSQASIEWITSLLPDVIFCFGWSRLIREPLLSLPPLGVIGFHPAGLPANRGRHPIIWALILGLDETASTFFRMDSCADSGDIISQVRLNINPSDDAGTLYARITKLAMAQLRDFVPRLANGSITPTPQNNSLANTWRKRDHADGRIDWRMAASSIHNLVRGLTRPYVGAHFDYGHQTIKVWQTEIEAKAPINLEPGKVLQVRHNSLLVKAGIGAIWLLNYDPIITVPTGSYL